MLPPNIHTPPKRISKKVKRRPNHVTSELSCLLIPLAAKLPDQFYFYSLLSRPGSAWHPAAWCQSGSLNQRISGWQPSQPLLESPACQRAWAEVRILQSQRVQQTATALFDGPGSGLQKNKNPYLRERISNRENKAGSAFGYLHSFLYTGMEWVGDVGWCGCGLC